MLLARESVYAAVADIERYPDFVPGWIEAQVRHREAGRLVVAQVVGRGPLRWLLVSEARLHPFDAIRIRGLNGPLRSLEIDWRFTAQGPQRCSVGLELTAAGASGMLARALGAMTATAAHDLIDLFERRARALRDATV